MVFGMVGRWSKSIGLSGLQWKYMKKHYSLLPIYGISIIGSGFFLAYIGRMLMTHPEISWSNRNPEPWNEYYNKQVKFFDAGRDYSVPSPAPKYR